jgi:rhodanese-related sulfurtransferase
VLALAEGGAVLLDSREITDFAAGHLHGAVNVALQGRFAEWAGDVLSPERDIVLVGDPTSALETKVRLARVGLDRVVGQLDGPTTLLASRPELHETSSRLTLEQLAELRGRGPDIQLVDVRNQAEIAQGTIAGAREIPLGALTASLEALDRTAPVVIYCASGSRSQVASSVLREAGFADVSDLLGGYAAWEAAGLPVTTTATSRERRPALS